MLINFFWDYCMKARSIYVLGVPTEAYKLFQMRNSKTEISLLETHQMFPVHITIEEFKNAAIKTHSGFVFEKKFTQGNDVIIAKTSVSKMFSVQTKTKSRGFQIHPV